MTLKTLYLSGRLRRGIVQIYISPLPTLTPAHVGKMRRLHVIFPVRLISEFYRLPCATQNTTPQITNSAGDIDFIVIREMKDSAKTGGEDVQGMITPSLGAR